MTLNNWVDESSLIPKWYPLITLRSMKRYHTQTRKFFATGVVKETSGTIRSETFLFYKKKNKEKEKRRKRKEKKKCVIRHFT